jgi:hypothetical protein
VFVMKDQKWSAVNSDFPPNLAHVRLTDRAVWESGSFRDVFRAQYKITPGGAPSAVVRIWTILCSVWKKKTKKREKKNLYIKKRERRQRERRQRERE